MAGTRHAKADQFYRLALGRRVHCSTPALPTAPHRGRVAVAAIRQSSGLRIMAFISTMARSAGTTRGRACLTLVEGRSFGITRQHIAESRLHRLQIFSIVLPGFHALFLNRLPYLLRARCMHDAIGFV